MDDIQAMVNRASKPENAIKILTNILMGHSSRGNGKSAMIAVTDAAICSAISALKKETQPGKWIKYELEETYGSNDSNTWYKCSECQKGAHGWVDEDTWYSFPHLSDYCPHCGAKMDGGKDDGSEN